MARRLAWLLLLALPLGCWEPPETMDGTDTDQVDSGSDDAPGTGTEPSILCGNGMLDPEEECDDGANGDQDDGCTDLCQLPRCGDSYEQESLGELCDDGNLDNDDGCLQDCVPASCGDGFTWVGQEGCDDGNTEDGDGCSSSCELETGWSCEGTVCSTVCGDGIIAGDECCDDGNTELDDGCPPSCTLVDRQVFVTSITHTADFNSLADADILCQNLAESAGVAGTFEAWLSTSETSPAERWAPIPACDVPYERIDGTVVATGWDDLLDGMLSAPISIDEFGDEVGAPCEVWTGTSPDGTADANLCVDWSSTTTNESGDHGLCTEIDSSWTDDFVYGTCAYERRLYCFEHSS